MPIFEYKCHKCNSEFEKLVFGAATESGVHCPGCDSSKVERLFSCFCGVSKGSDGSSRSITSSGCSSCSAGSCAGCSH
jgi:putative FmdB family regulatory protein